MTSEDRKNSILEGLGRSGSVSVAELSRTFRVAPMTVRRDLLALERKGLLVRRYGGAVRSETASRLFSFTERMGLKKVEKRAIGAKAAELVGDNETVFIDCGSTAFQMCSHLRGKRNLRVISTSLPVISELILNPAVRLFLVGGDILHERRASYGRTAEKTLAACRADKAFIGADGVSLAGGLSAYDEREGLISRTIAERSREVYVLCDSGKLETESFFPFLPLDRITAVITDSGLDKSTAGIYRRKGIRIIIA